MFVVIDKDLIKFGVVDKVLKVLENVGIFYEIFSEIKLNFIVSNVKVGVEVFVKLGVDFILVIGGGLFIDILKVIGIIINNLDFSDVVLLEGVVFIRKKLVFIIVLFIIVGIVVEVIINYVIMDEENYKKMVCVDLNDIFVIVIVDVELMYILFKGLIVFIGLDVLIYVIEGLIIKGVWEMSDMFEIKVIEMIVCYLEIVVFEFINVEVCNGMVVV